LDIIFSGNHENNRFGFFSTLLPRPVGTVNDPSDNLLTANFTFSVNKYNDAITTLVASHPNANEIVIVDMNDGFIDIDTDFSDDIVSDFLMI
jgi:hypothetical protein